MSFVLYLIIRESFGFVAVNPNFFLKFFRGPGYTVGMSKSDDPLRVLSLRVRHHREAAGLTRPALAARVGVTVETVENWEQGRNAPAVGTLPALAEALGVPVCGLFRPFARGEEPPPLPRGRPRRKAPGGEA